MFQHLITINNNKKTMFNHITLSVILVSFIVFYSYFELVFNFFIFCFQFNFSYSFSNFVERFVVFISFISTNNEKCFTVLTLVTLNISRQISTQNVHLSVQTHIGSKQPNSLFHYMAPSIFLIFAENRHNLYLQINGSHFCKALRL